MLAGFGTTLFYLVWTAAPPLGFALPTWFGVANISAGLFGMPVGFIVMIVVSKITPEPSAEMQAFIDEIRRPRGDVVVHSGEGANA
jgi:cation/acetate symporter